MNLRERLGSDGMEGNGNGEMARQSWGLKTARNATEGLTAAEQECKHKLFRKLVKVLDLSLLGTLDEREARQQIQQVCESLMSEEALPFNAAVRQRIVKELQDEVLGLGPLEALLADKSVSDILVNGTTPIFVERRGKLEQTVLRFDSDRHLMTIIDRIVSSVGRRIDESSPMVDARLKDGSRVNAVIPPLAIDGPMLSIRRFAVERLNAENLVEIGTLTPEVAQLLEKVVKARLNVLVSGGTGAGKTTLLNILSGFIPHDERIVTIEDSAELQLQQPHVVRLETRPPNIEGRGEVTQRDLVRNSLRMRPDRIILGEVRGSEAFDMLQAMNTGHDGSLTTIHANTPRDALTRIESMVAMSGFQLPAKALRAQIASAIDVVVQVERQEDGKRRLVSVQEINGQEGDIITMSEIFRFEREGIDEEGKVIGRFTATGVVPGFYDYLKRRGMAPPLEVFQIGGGQRPWN
ncbi:CpaF pilus assembly protein, ATPase CpaF [Litchfieldella anticariensis FP35 = DSM 16096]|uniref:CpaF pilus assembly protein, ATPase CpaF n=1 Tax=Litchfieldella anticariensis (strain DSM 16096 / CECT 5854 / CIP 108499 / LMG 22089 / FP35) TaxID=1121939 RepID=S2LCJ3_LITA3|nr:CpaF family protein [Halomonas anticariensis]EPC02456.1 CpaF pilus assembly protein, ATPase CpaF [Halomonas anticariensis FP35 = DSM 16096]